MGQGSSAWAAVRLEILGGGGPSARTQEPPLELQVQMEELAALSVGEPECFDLKQPWLYAPR